MKKIVIMPGGFHPFHAGHYALYQSAKKAFPDADMYVAASDSRTERPFPFQIKQKLAQVAGVKPNEFVQVKLPFRSEEITAKYNPEEDALIFVRSEKDKTEQPIPGGTKKDGTPAYFQPYNPKDVKPFKQHGYITYLPTVEFAGGIKSATEIRNQWPHLSDRQKANMIQTLYPETTGNKKLISNVVGLMDTGMGALAEMILRPLPSGNAKISNTGKKKKRVNEDEQGVVNPQFDFEWEEAQRYPEFKKLGKDGWVELASKGKTLTITDASDIENTDAGKPESFYNLDKDKQQRALQQIARGSVELPIVAAYSDGHKELIGGNTRLTVMMLRHGKAKVWQFNVPDEILDEGEVVDMTTPMSAEFINWLKTKDLTIADLKDRAKLRKLRLHYEKETGNKLDEGEVVQFRPRKMRELSDRLKLPVAVWWHEKDSDKGNMMKALLQQNGFKIALDDNKITLKWPTGEHSVLKVEDAMELLIKELHRDPEQFKEDRYWNVGDGQNEPASGIQPSEELRLKKTHNRAGAFVENIRHMIKTATNEEREKTLHLHRKAFELMEEEKNNVVQLRGFGKESDKKVVDIQKVRQEKEREQEKRNDAYDKKRRNQEHMLHVIQQILFGLHEEIGDMIQLNLAPIEFIDFQQEVESMIDQIDKFDANDFPFYDDDGNLLSEMFNRIKVIKEAWLNQKAHTFEAFRNDPILAPMPGGTVDTSDPKVLRPEEMKSERPIKFWTDLSEKVDYIEEK